MSIHSYIALMQTGAATILEMAAAAGVSVCFANPGTTELGLVAALEGRSSIRPVLGLFEGVCTGAADGFARVRYVPALTLLHLGPGFANGMANLHNARRAGSGVLNLVGDHPASHLVHDSPLTSDIVGMAATVSDWVRATTTETVAADTADALAAAARGLVATLVVPIDVQTQPAAPGTPAAAAAETFAVPSVDETALALTRAGTVLFLGGDALRAEALRLAHRIRQLTGCRVLTQTFTARIDRGRGIPAFPAVPYFPEAAAAGLADTSALVSIGAPEPVANFAFPGVPGRLVPESAERFDLTQGDPVAMLEAIVEHLGAPDAAVPEAERAAFSPSDPVTARSIGAIVAANLEEGSVVVDEGATSSFGYVRTAAAAEPHMALGLTGGAIGIGLPLAVGAAMATDRRVMALQADGSGMYTNQALWTLAREGLDVTVILLANDRYAILQTEMQRAGVDELGAVSRSLTELTDPSIDFVALAAAMGVPGARCATNDDAAQAIAKSMAEPGPFLIQVDLQNV